MEEIRQLVGRRKHWEEVKRGFSDLDQRMSDCLYHAQITNGMYSAFALEYSAFGMEYSAFGME
jgi:hypothetical protein